MNQIKYPNNRILNNYIEHISYNENIPNPDEFTPVLPDGMTELVINLGKSYERHTGNLQKIENVNSSHFIGIKSKLHFIKSDINTKTLSVRFKPGVLPLFTNINISDLTDMVIDAELVFSKDLNKTENKIKNMEDAKLMILEVEKFLLKRLTLNQKALQTIEISRLIYNNPSISKLEFLKKKTGINYKQLERNFIRYIGLHPKSFMNIVKFNYTTKLIYEQPLKPLAQIALDSGYFDQSHFIKSFKNFSGQTPKNFISRFSERESINQITINRQF